MVQQIDPDVYDPAKDGLPAENTYSDPSAGHTYEYAENGNLVSETTKYGIETEYSYSGTGNLQLKHFDIYDYYYLENGKIDKIRVDGKTVVDYEYEVTDSGISCSKGYHIDQVKFANGDTESYKYNSAGTLTAIYKNGEKEPQEYWNQSVDFYSRLPSTRNYETGLCYKYDEEKQEVSVFNSTNLYIDTQPDQIYQSTQTDADETTDTPATSTVSGTVYSTDFSIFTDGSQIKNAVGELNSTYTYNTDENGVLVSDGIALGENTVLPATYIYDDSGRNTEKSITLADNNIVKLQVQYDENGMLTGSGADEITAHYTYDANGQLVRTNDRYAEYTSAYEYDSRGNMLSKKQYGYTTGDLNGITPRETTTFTYANSGWKDQLVAVNGTSLTYDENGNLRTYGDKTYSWSHGTRLESITDGENEYSYIYDENGIRFSKTVNGATTQFVYLGGMLMAQKTGDDVLFFQYGAGGVPLGFVYNGVQYFYITNQLGDVVGIANAQGEPIAAYSYDEWGNPIETVTRDDTEEQNKIAEINPLRYRGYYYDTDTGYYYLQSRYYNPEWGRFISPDSFGYIDNSTQLGFNAYVYCVNNPIMYIDPTGTEKINNVVEAIFNALVIFFKIDFAFPEFRFNLEPISNFVSDLGKRIGVIITEIFTCLDLQEIAKRLSLTFKFNNLWDYLNQKVKLYGEAFNEGIIKPWTSENKNAIDFSNILSNISNFFGDAFKKFSASFNLLPYIMLMVDDFSGRYLTPIGEFIMAGFDLFINGIIDLGSAVATVLVSPLAGAAVNTSLSNWVSYLGTREKAEFYAYNWYLIPLLLFDKNWH